MLEMDECACGFAENDNGFPDNPVLGQSYVPWQVIYIVLDLIRNRNYINTRYIYESIKYSIFGGIESYLWFFI